MFCLNCFNFLEPEHICPAFSCQRVDLQTKEKIATIVLFCLRESKMEVDKCVSKSKREKERPPGMKQSDTESDFHCTILISQKFKRRQSF